jgi:hypothetical protein
MKYTSFVVMMAAVLAAILAAGCMSAPEKGIVIEPDKLLSTSDAKALPVAKAVGSTPINSVDLVSGNPVNYGIPTSVYKGYVIGFCCAVSRSDWGKMSDSEKDALVRRFID